MATAEAIGRYFLWLAVSGEPTPLTQMHLHKLLYYAQGWSLASRGQRLFDEPIQAWVHGPVVPSVYPVFADYDSSPIAPHEARDAGITDEDRAFVETVWRRYGRYSAWRLREMTHSEAPWQSARGRTPEGSASKAIISDTSMASFFHGLHETECHRLGTTSAAFANALASARAGATMPLDEAISMWRAPKA